MKFDVVAYMQDSIPADMMSTPQAAASNDDLFGGLL